MAKTKTKKKKEEIVDLKPEKITKEQLEKVQKVINDINMSQMELGQLETKKHAVLHHVAALQEAVGKMKEEFERDYGTSDVNIQDGIINYSKENGEVNKED